MDAQLEWMMSEQGSLACSVNNWSPYSDTVCEYDSPDILLAEIARKTGVIDDQYECCRSQNTANMRGSIQFLQRNDLPESYKSYTAKEQLMLECLNRFVTQFSRLYPERKSQFILPKNDCGVPKMVCTFLKPTLLPYDECFYWSGCSTFICDHLDMRNLEDPTHVPTTMLSPSQVLRYQSANVFEFSTVLCSFLLGTGYNAYVISGYAVQSICKRDTTRIKCELRTETVTVDKHSGLSEQDNSDQIYTSKYELMMKNREEQAISKLKQQEIEQDLQKITELEKEEIDELHGRRVHSWILILPGKRDVKQPFFIEPTLGEKRDIDSPDYLGIESLWNDRNYWINMQLTSGVKHLQYDLYNPKHWEYFLLSDAMLTPHPQQTKAMFEEDTIDARDLLEMPYSWVERLEIPRSKYQSRFPRGQRVMHFYRTKLEVFTPYSNKDGIVRRVTRYDDFAYTKAISIEERFAHRTDCLLSRDFDPITTRLTESFALGRADKLIRHEYFLSQNYTESFRLLEYDHKTRHNGLNKRRINGQGCVEEEYLGRPDGINRRIVEFAPISAGTDSRCDPDIIAITEYLNVIDRESPRNASKRVYELKKNTISITFHAVQEQSEYRHFVKAQLDDHGNFLSTLEKASNSNNANAFIPSKSARLTDMFDMYKALLSLEQKAINESLESQTEISNLLKSRCEEEQSVDIVYDLFDSDLSPSVRNERKTLEQKQAAEAKRLLEESRDPLASLLRKTGKTADQLSAEEKQQLCEECITNFREKLVAKGERILCKFKQATEDLESRQNTHSKDGRKVTAEEEKEYVEHCQNAMHRIQMLEQLLESHKYMSPIRINSLRKHLANDPRVNYVH